MSKTIKKTLLASTIMTVISGFTINNALAADVPAGVELAAKQELVRNVGSEVVSLDPHKVEGVPEATVLRDLLESLIITDPNGKVTPGAAESWDSDDFKIWTFHLRKNGKWSNGEPVTAQDFVYSFQRLADPNTASPYASYLEYAQLENINDVVAGKKPVSALGLKALDDYTFQVTLSAPVPYFVKMLSHTSMRPVNSRAIAKYGDKWTQPQNWVGNGAYKLKNWVVNERIVLERNPAYWNNDKTVINQVTYLPIESEVTDVNRYRTGEIDMTYTNLPIELFQKLKTELPNELHLDPYLCVYFYEFNNKKPPLDNVNVRTALKLALDSDLITNKVKNQGDLPAYTYTPPFTAGADKIKQPEWAAWTQEQRNAKSIKLLQAAGYSKSNPVKFELLYNTSDLHKKLAIAATSIWKKNLDGYVEVTMVNQEWKTFLDTRRLGNHQVSRAGWCADYNESSSFLNVLLSDSSNNRYFYNNPEFDALMKKALLVKTDDERAAVYAEAETLIDKDSVMAPVFHYVTTRLAKPYVGGYTGKNPLDEIYVKDLYIIKH